MAINDAHQANFEMLKAAFENDDVALMECKRVSDGATVVLLCAAAFDGEEYLFTPFAEMVDGNPFELYVPPTGDEEVAAR